MEKENNLNRRNSEQSHQGQEHGRVHQVQEREQRDHKHISHSQEKVLIAGQKAEWRGEEHKHHVAHEKNITIFIDHKPYQIKSPHITGGEVRKLPDPEIDPSRDIFHVVAGNTENVKMSDTDAIEVNIRVSNHGRHFISSLSTEELSRTAYFAYLNRGSRHGHDVEDWLEAEGQPNNKSVK
jgi:hypothetical protein